MTTTDSNGIMFLELSDNISPFHTLMNSLQSATSAAVEKATRGPLYAANTTARNALLTQYGSSASNPLWVYTDGVLEAHNGTSWVRIAPEPDPWPAVANRVVGARRTTTGSVPAGSMSSILTVSLPANSPAGVYLVNIDVVLSSSAAGRANVRATTTAPVVSLTNDDLMYLGPTGGRGSFAAHMTHPGGARTITLSVQPNISGVSAIAGSKLVVTWVGPNV